MRYGGFTIDKSADPAILGTNTYVHTHLHIEPYPIGRAHTHAGDATGPYTHRHNKPFAHANSLHVRTNPDCTPNRHVKWQWGKRP